MTPPHLTLAGALARIAEGRIVPTCKYTALQRQGYIKVRGHGSKSKPVVTESGRYLLTACASGADG